MELTTESRAIERSSEAEQPEEASARRMRMEVSFARARARGDSFIKRNAQRDYCELPSWLARLKVTRARARERERERVRRVKSGRATLLVKQALRLLDARRT